MQYEVPLLRSMGFEVFVPKIIPRTTEFRSGAVDFSFDESLTIPKHALRVLNSCRFYEGNWPSNVVFYMNRYFGTALVMPVEEQFRESVTKFEGNLLMRAFGLINTASYHEDLRNMYGDQVFCWINAVHHRFWFAAGYEQLKECEPSLLAERSVYLPIGLPPAFWKNANTWTGTDRRLLLLCPSIVKNPYYAAIYKQFKREFGDLPHVIVGKQDVPVNDPNVLGFVSDQTLVDLYKTCSVLLYPSRENRHVHYFPVEANVVGTPLIFYDDSLLARICNRKVQGAVSSVAEARDLIKAILKGKADLITSIKKDQQDIAYFFSDEFCKGIWQKSFAAIGLGEGLGKASVPSTFADETKRVLFYPWARGKISPPLKRVPISLPARARIYLVGELPDYEATFEQGVDFRRPGYPTFIKYATGISKLEEWGRWSDGPKVTFTLANPLKGKFKLILVVGALGKNVGTPIPVKIGHMVQKVTFSGAPPHTMETRTLEFALRRPANTIEFTIPHPTTPERDKRQLGIGFLELRIELLDESGHNRPPR
jgi:hypothetical protein